MDSQTNLNYQGRDQLIINQPERVKLDVSSPGPRPVSVTGLDPIAPRIDRWIDRTQEQAALLARMEAERVDLEHRRLRFLSVRGRFQS